MRISTCVFCLVVGNVSAVGLAEGSPGASLLGALFRPLDALNLQSALSPSSSILRGNRPVASSETKSFLPKQGDISLLDSANTLELLSSIRLPRQSVTDYLQRKTTGFSNRNFTIVSALFGDEVADQRLKDALGPVIHITNRCCLQNAFGSKWGIPCQCFSCHIFVLKLCALRCVSAGDYTLGAKGRRRFP